MKEILPSSMDWLYYSMALFFILQPHIAAEAGAVGVNYGRLGNNLPPPTQVIQLLQSRNVNRIRLFSPDQDVLAALQGSGIEVIVGTDNQDLQNLGSDVSYAISWVNNNIVPYSGTVTFRCVAAGNEVIPSDLATCVLPAMKNLKTALQSVNLGNIAVSTAVSTAVLGNSYPPSVGVFFNNDVMGPIVSFLAENQNPLLLNVYPYFAYASNPNDISLSYALLTSNQVVVWDGALGYTNLFDAMVDATYSALEKAGCGSIDIVVSETGWPSAQNGDIATIPNAQTYINKLIEHASSGSGTPKRPGESIETYIFAVFNENLKPPGIEQNFGLFYPDMTEVYQVDFN